MDVGKNVIEDNGIRDEPADGCYGGSANDNDEDDEEQRPRPSGSDGERTKRRRTASPDGGGPNTISPDFMKQDKSGTDQNKCQGKSTAPQDESTRES